ncbi:MAG: DNA polymerase [Deltaproteobacteria bacterium]|nr:DNA polymerase [Deltaproteobacteria bacterium]
MTVIAWDIETHPIVDGCNTPKLVCISSCDGENADLFLATEGLVKLREWLLDPTIILVGHNLPYDLCVACVEDPTLLSLVFTAIEQNRIHDNQIRQAVIANYAGKLKFEWDADSHKWNKSRFDQATLVAEYTGRRPKKGADSVQLRYGEVDGLAIEHWPEEFIDYAVGDSIDAFDVWQAQEEGLPESGLPQNWRHMAHAWALQLASTRGFRTDRGKTLALEAALGHEMAAHIEVVKSYGFIRESSTKNEKATRAAVARLVKQPMLTRTGLISLKREQLQGVPCPECGLDFDAHKKADSGCMAQGEHIGLWAFSEVKRVEKQISTYIKVLKHGFDHPIQCHYNVIIETYRTSCARPNIQNYPRSGGIRDCIVPREGWVFAFCDLDTVEMGTLAQTCIDLFGYSKLADAINAGRDVHIDFASKLLQIPYDECLKRYEEGDPEIERARQYCKICNYGAAGGLGPDAFVEYAKNGYGMDITREFAVRLLTQFRDAWELYDYFSYCANSIGPEGDCRFLQHPRSKLVRGHVRYTSVCNYFFQHLAAMLAKDSLYFVTKECYAVPDSPLYGSRPWLFAHDEIGLEIPEAWIGTAASSDAARRMQEIMVACAKHWCPDVTIGATVAMARSWLKGAKPVNDEHGNLVPVKKANKEWIHDRVA